MQLFLFREIKEFNTRKFGYHFLIKKLGKKKFIQAYEMEQNMIAQGHKKDKHDPYNDNRFEEAAEKFAKKQISHWKKALSKSKQMRF